MSHLMAYVSALGQTPISDPDLSLNSSPVARAVLGGTAEGLGLGDVMDGVDAEPLKVGGIGHMSVVHQDGLFNNGGKVSRIFDEVMAKAGQENK